MHCGLTSHPHLLDLGCDILILMFEEICNFGNFASLVQGWGVYLGNILCKGYTLVEF